MDDQPEERTRSRGALVNFVLVAIPAGSFIFFLNLVSLGVFFWVIASVFGLVLLGFLHYLLWGFALSEDVAAEREEQKIKDDMRLDRDD